MHDVGAYQNPAGRTAKLPAGAVLTIEPGLYFGARDQRVPKELRGIGIRIEADVLVTDTGREVLTNAVPKSIADIEALCRQEVSG